MNLQSVIFSDVGGFDHEHALRAGRSELSARDRGDLPERMRIGDQQVTQVQDRKGFAGNPEPSDTSLERSVTKAHGPRTFKKSPKHTWSVSVVANGLVEEGGTDAFHEKSTVFAGPVANRWLKNKRCFVKFCSGDAP